MRRKRNKENQGHASELRAWITLLWHIGLRLPQSWHLGASDSSEREHVMGILGTESFPDQTLFCGDASFVGFPLWACLFQRQSDIQVRVGSNVSLLNEHAHFVLPPKGPLDSVLAPKGFAVGPTTSATALAAGSCEQDLRLDADERAGVNYYVRFYRSALTPVLRHLERALIRCASRVPENARLFARESLETKQKLHEMWKAQTASESAAIVVNG